MGRGIIEAAPITVWEAVRNPLSRYIYDNMLKVTSLGYLSNLQRRDGGGQREEGRGDFHRPLEARRFHVKEEFEGYWPDWDRKWKDVNDLPISWFFAVILLALLLVILQDANFVLYFFRKSTLSSMLKTAWKSVSTQLRKIIFVYQNSPCSLFVTDSQILTSHVNSLLGFSLHSGFFFLGSPVFLPQ